MWVVAAGLLAAVAVAELLARWWVRYQRAYYVLPPGQRLRLHLDRATFPELDPIVRFEVNSDGERGDEVPRRASGETLYRVLVVGGSQPEGYFLDQHASWPGALQRMLEAPDRLRKLRASKAHVGSIARSGVGSQALDFLLERVLPRYRGLQAIVILVGASDVLRWLEHGAAETPPAPAVSDVFRSHPEGPFGWTLQSSAITEVVRRARQRWLRPLQTHECAGKWVGQARAMRARAKVIHATIPDPSRMIVHFETHLRSAIRRAQACADRVLVVRQSWFEKDKYTAEEISHFWHGGVGQAWREDVSAYYSVEVTSHLMRLIDASASRVAEEQGVEQIDLMSILEPSLHTYYDFFHLTPAGAREVAAAVASVLVHERRVRATAVGQSVSRCVDLRAS
jgi:lysophospholipase L1-like esterase